MLALLLFAGCVSRTGDFGSPALSKSAWSYPRSTAERNLSVLMGDGVVLVSATPTLLALDERTGAVRWRANDSSKRAVVADDLLIYGTPTASVRARYVRGGGIAWKIDQVCTPPRYPDPSGGIDTLASSGKSVIVGCEGGSLASLDRRTGAVRARSKTFKVDFISSIQPIGSCAYAVSGTVYASGRTFIEIVGCKSLDVIVPQLADTIALGAIGETAVLDNRCCLRTHRFYRPETIFTIDLIDGSVSARTDVIPKAKRPRSAWPSWYETAWAFLQDEQLYVSVDRALYYYGDPRNLTTAPPRVAVGGTPMDDGRYIVQCVNLIGMRITTVVQLFGPRTRTVWSMPSEGDGDSYYDRSVDTTRGLPCARVGRR